MTLLQITSVAVFVITMIAVMTEKVQRSVAAMTGGIALVLLHVLTLEESIQFIDFNTIGVLVGMMLFVAVVRESGIFEYIAIKSAKLSKGKPWVIMVSFMIVTAVLSAFLDNVTTVLLVGPMTLAVTRILGLNPIPFFMTQIMASNIGGTATLIGDPPNIMIGNQAHLSFLAFLENTGPAVVVIMIFYIFAFHFIYGKNLAVTPDKMQKIMDLNERDSIKDYPLLIKSIVVMFLVIIAFILHSVIHVDTCIVALSAAAIMLLIGKQSPEKTIEHVEWTTIIFFMGLFVVVGGMQHTGVIDMLAKGLLDLTNGNEMLTIIVILWVSAVVSAFLDNIPFVATMIPLIMAMEAGGINVYPLWWALSLGACLGGNGTLVGASANVVLSDISKKHGHPITFKNYFKVGFPLMIASIVISTVYLMIKF